MKSVNKVFNIASIGCIKALWGISMLYSANKLLYQDPSAYEAMVFSNIFWLSIFFFSLPFKLSNQKSEELTNEQNEPNL